MESKNTFLKRLAGFSLGPIIGAFISFIIVPVQTWLIDPTQLGKASMYTMAYGLSSLFIYLGIDQSYVREYNAEEDKKNLLWNSFIIPFIFSLIVMIIYLIFYKQISNLLFGSEEKLIINILALSLPFSVIYRFNILNIRMKEKAKLYSLIEILNKLILLCVIVINLVFFNRNFKGVIQSQFLSIVIISIITTFININDWKYKLKFNKKLLKKIILFGLPLIPASIMSWILNSMDKIALRAWSDFESIGLYSAAFKIVGIIIIVQQAFATFWSPTVYRWYENNVAKEKYEIVSNKLNSIMILLFGFIILFKDFIIKILSPEYSEASVIIPFLMFYPIMYTLSETTQMGISFSRKTYYNIIVTGVSGGINILGNYLLVPKYGALGASISTGISYIIFFWLRTIISRFLWVKLNIKRHIISTIMMIFFAFLSIMYNNFIINFFSFILIVIYTFKDIKSAFYYIKSIINFKIQKSSDK
ncbi:O-antigen/teichoic acid export membrane protein [Oceanotoga teriensis]|uniref:O-antigen/teichoic acid export membrane protein n=1 Tax=Oceanotoga teriensis TaxID=515440 RepID=A0AA45HHR6_9BACT|nr:oligosaccharide flippase family protein [Oceanotoga teriensis]PWJ88093.1 O-antigen/teichoic acid export membrane protein [Oceanotoga teriensis]